MDAGTSANWQSVGNMTATLAPCCRPGNWFQADCSLFPDSRLEPHIPWAALSEAVRRWREQDLIHRFWYVRKPPGLRLRFEAAPDRGFQAVLASWLIEAEHRNAIRGFRFTTYEPEAYRFGGMAGMETAHSLFDVKATLALHYYSKSAVPVSALQLSFATTADLLNRCLDDPAEIWDVWCRLSDALSSTREVINDSEISVREFLIGRASLCEILAEDWQPVLRQVDATHARVATDLRALAGAGTLKVGARAWLAAATVFDWNRFGLPNRLLELINAAAEAKRWLAPDGERR
jgi:thiopeptide-type bacteriocin biosynthesis protein